MRIPQWVKPAVWGAIIGAGAIMIIGFSWWGWVLGSTAETMAQERKDSALVAVVTPICVEKFMAQPEKLAELQKTASWQQREFIEKGGWAVVPGNATPSSALVAACTEQLRTKKT